MTKDAYILITNRTRRALSRLPGGEKLTRVPTLLCAAVYCATLLYLMLLRDVRLFRAILVPAACFFACTILRALINRERPYDRFGAPPVGKFVSGKGKSLPSRHTASAVAIVYAVCYVFPSPVTSFSMALLAALIGLLRVFCGQHYPGDVLASILLSTVISLTGFIIL